MLVLVLQRALFLFWFFRSRLHYLNYHILLCYPWSSFLKLLFLFSSSTNSTLSDLSSLMLLGAPPGLRARWLFLFSALSTSENSQHRYCASAQGQPLRSIATKTIVEELDQTVMNFSYLHSLSVIIFQQTSFFFYKKTYARPTVTTAAILTCHLVPRVMPIYTFAFSRMVIPVLFKRLL